MSQLLEKFLSSIGEEVYDAEEESFLLFSRTIPSNNLGFVDSRATTLDITVGDHDYTIHQSPTLLSSRREGGTTGAVLWKITPLFAHWISSTTTNPFWTNQIIGSSEGASTTTTTTTTTVIELGCGISGLVALSLAPLVKRYVATDQEYVRRYFRQNIEENISSLSLHNAAPSSKSVKSLKNSRKIDAASKKPRGAAAGGGGARSAGKQAKQSSSSNNENISNIKFVSLDWEQDILSNHSLHGSDHNNDDEEDGFDLVVSCDCIYNEALIPSFVRTCVDVCRLRRLQPSFSSITNTDRLANNNSSSNNRDRQNGLEEPKNPTIVIIAQQQRSPDVFEAWLRESLKYFRVWRVDKFDTTTGNYSGLEDGSGYVVHVLVLRDHLPESAEERKG